VRRSPAGRPAWTAPRTVGPRRLLRSPPWSGRSGRRSAGATLHARPTPRPPCRRRGRGRPPRPARRAPRYSRAAPTRIRSCAAPRRGRRHGQPLRSLSPPPCSERQPACPRLTTQPRQRCGPSTAQNSSPMPRERSSTATRDRSPPLMCRGCSPGSRNADTWYPRPNTSSLLAGPAGMVGLGHWPDAPTADFWSGHDVFPRQQQCGGGSA
jgi:hypothetical protein